jgi:Ca2+-binding RTX toxin-like protein
MANITGTSGDDLIHVSGDGEENNYPDPPYNEIALATDVIIGSGVDNSQFVVQSGDDNITAGGGDDVIFSGGGWDVIAGGAGNDIIHANGAIIIDPDGNDGDGFTVVGGGVINGNNGDDDITAGYDETINGGNGTDTVHLNLVFDYVPWAAHTILHWFNAQAETVDLSAAATGTITLNIDGLGSLYDTVSNVEAFDIVFGSGNDVVTGSLGNDTLQGDNFSGVVGGNDTIGGNDGDDHLLGEGGNDTLSGDAGNDTVEGGMAPGSFDDSQSDSIAGGADNDILIGGSGDLFDGGTGTDAAVIHLERSTYSYNINLASATSSTLYNFGDVTSLQTQFGSTAITHGTETQNLEHINELDLGSGNDTVSGDPNLIDLLSMGDGNDTVNFTGTMPSTTLVEGGIGTDVLNLSGDYSTQFVLDFMSVTGFETINLAAGNDYNFKFNIGATDILNIDGSGLGSGDNMTLDVSLYADTTLEIDGGAGNDWVYYGDELVSGQHFDGGAGSDTLELGGGNVTLTFGAQTVKNVETIKFDASPVGWGPYAYSLTLANGNVASGATMTLDGSSLGANGYADTLTIDGHQESDGHYIMLGGAANDTLTGGDQSDSFTGGLGADTLKGNGGADTFVYAATTDSYSVNNAYDRLVGFDPTVDKIDLWFGVNAIDAAITGGTLGTLHNLADAAHLGVHDALLFTANNGNIYVVVDSNGTAGYQTGDDLIIRVDGGSNLSSLSTSTFV